MSATLKVHGSQTTYRTLFWLFLACITAFRLLLAGKFGLGVDESHYLLFSRRLAWGYFDHPPMVAFLAALTTPAGNSVLFIRLGPIMCSAAGIILMRYLALALYRDERVAFWGAALLNLMPYQQLLMVALLPDATLNLFWCGTLLAVWYALQKGKWALWILAGVLFGGALLSKYHAVLLPLCLLGYLLSSPDQRFWLGRPQPYAAGLTGLAVFMPNIFWNSRHDWISYAYQFGRGSGEGLNPGKFLLALGGQFGVWSPLIFGLLIAAAVVMLRDQKPSAADRFVVWTSIPVFAFFCLTGMTSKILPHWTAAGWWTGSIAVSVAVMRRIFRPDRVGIRWRRWSVAAIVTGLMMSLLLYAALFRPITGSVYTWARGISVQLNRQFPAIKALDPFDPAFDIGNELFGWEKIAETVEAIRARMPNPQKTFIFGHRFFKASQLAVYLPPDTVVMPLHHKFDQYRLWFAAPDYQAWDALLIIGDRHHFDRAQRYRPLFTAMDPEPVEIRVFRDNQLAQDLKVYKYFGFKGEYER